MKSLMLLLQAVLADAGTRCCTSTDLDYKTIEARVTDEGISFLTISLANYGKGLQKALDRGFVTHEDFSGFRFSSGLPRLFGGFLELIFDRASGRLVDNPSTDAIQAVRQITLLFSKLEIPCTEQRVFNAIEGYINCEREIRANDRLLGGRLLDDYLSLCVTLWAPAFSALDRKVWAGELLPRHGSGSTAERRLGNQKFVQWEWTERLNRVFPVGKYILPSDRYYKVLDHVNLLEPGAERPVRVVTVPKTLKTPRIIAIEPVCMQYMQQAIMKEMYELIEKDGLISRFLQFSDQTPNQVMAREGSLSGDLATLDLSEASDRVSNQLVRAMFSRFPHIAEAIDATRSRKADVPGHGVVRLAKFASMGSALCFPIESMVFLTLIFLGISKKLNRRLSRRDIKSFAGRVRVFGDDLVVPREFVQSVIECLEAFGFKVNHNKSYWTGRFRESCGKDYYAGDDVSVVKCKQLIPASRKDVTEVESLVSFRNHMYYAGYWRTVRHLDELLSGLFGGNYPAVGPGSSVLGKVSFLGHEILAWDVALQHPVVLGYVSQTVLPTNRVDGIFALLKWFLKEGEEPFAERDHLERSGRPEAVSIKLRLARAF